MVKTLLTCLFLAFCGYPAFCARVAAASHYHAAIPSHSGTDTPTHSPADTPRHSAADTVIPNQGIEGTVYRISGNRMPAPGFKPGPLRGVPSTLYVFELTNISQVIRVGQSPWYSAVHTLLVKVEATDSLGHFRVYLPVGRYSIFTKKNGLFYASQFDTDNNIAPVEVVPGAMTKVDCHIEGDRKPVY